MITPYIIALNRAIIEAEACKFQHTAGVLRKMLQQAWLSCHKEAAP